MWVEMLVAEVVPMPPMLLLAVAELKGLAAPLATVEAFPESAAASKNEFLEFLPKPAPTLL